MLFMVFSEALIHWQVNHSTFTLPNYIALLSMRKSIPTEFLPTVAGDFCLCGRILGISLEITLQCISK